MGADPTDLARAVVVLPSPVLDEHLGNVGITRDSHPTAVGSLLHLGDVRIPRAERLKVPQALETRSAHSSSARRIEVDHP